TPRILLAASGRTDDRGTVRSRRAVRETRVQWPRRALQPANFSLRKKPSDAARDCSTQTCRANDFWEPLAAPSGYHAPTGYKAGWPAVAGATTSRTQGSHS